MAASRQGLPRSSVLLMLAWLLVIVSALAVTYSTHWSRELLNQLAAEMTEREKHHAEWGRLVLEQSTWTAHSRIETLAERELGMRVPNPAEVILVKP